MQARRFVQRLTRHKPHPCNLVNKRFSFLEPDGAGLSWRLLLHAGKVSFKMLMVYVDAMGGKLRFTILMSWFLLVELCRVGATVWLSYWTGIADSPGAHMSIYIIHKQNTCKYVHTTSNIRVTCCTYIITCNICVTQFMYT